MTVRSPAEATHPRKRVPMILVTVRYGARVNHEWFPLIRAAEADALVERLVAEGAELIPTCWCDPADGHSCGA